MRDTNTGNAKSFICERTAEYILVPKLTSILRSRFKVIVPIFPWATREGGNLSKQIHKNDQFRVVGMFPRRPKLNSVNSSNIIIKINHQILVGAQYSIKFGIPIIAGCPLTKNLWELDNSPECIWIKLEQRSQDDFEIDTGNIQSFIPDWIFPSEELLLNYLSEYSILMDYQKAIESFKQTRGFLRETGYYRYFGIGGYKPVYFLLI
jgi:hypothetical protein